MRRTDLVVILQVNFECNQRDSAPRVASPVSCPGGQSPGSPLQLTPSLTESQCSRLAEAAEALAKTLPVFECKPQNSKKKFYRDLEVGILWFSIRTLRFPKLPQVAQESF